MRIKNSKFLVQRSDAFATVNFVQIYFWHEIQKVKFKNVAKELAKRKKN